MSHCEQMSGRGLFVGLITLDLIYGVEALPTSNQKIVALADAIAAGGPATNAAVTFRHLGHGATVLGALGQHPMTTLIRAELAQWGVAIADLAPQQPTPPPVSSILVTQATGERAVVSLNAQKTQRAVEHIPAEIWTALHQGEIEVVLIDGHQMAVGEAIAQQARARGIPIVVDGGSWKPGFDAVLRQADYVIASANFWPPGCTTHEQVMAYLQALGVGHIAITHGARPIQGMRGDRPFWLEVPAITPVDTLGAGDILHGAFCHYIHSLDFEAALSQAAQVAAHACQSFGTRHWMMHESGEAVAGDTEANGV